MKPGLSVLCVPTHLLCHLDDPVSVVERYVRRHARAGDVLMQRFKVVETASAD